MTTGKEPPYMRNHRSTIHTNTWHYVLHEDAWGRSKAGTGINCQMRAASTNDNIKPGLGGCIICNVTAQSREPRLNATKLQFTDHNFFFAWWRAPVPVPLCPPQISHALTRDRTRASAVRGWWLTAWAMAGPMIHTLLDLHVAFARRANGWSVGTFQKVMPFRKSGQWMEKYFRCFISVQG